MEEVTHKIRCDFHHHTRALSYLAGELISMADTIYCLHLWRYFAVWRCIWIFNIVNTVSISG